MSRLEEERNLNDSLRDFGNKIENPDRTLNRFERVFNEVNEIMPKLSKKIHAFASTEVEKYAEQLKDIIAANIEGFSQIPLRTKSFEKYRAVFDSVNRNQAELFEAGQKEFPCGLSFSAKLEVSDGFDIDSLMDNPSSFTALSMYFEMPLKCTYIKPISTVEASRFQRNYDNFKDELSPSKSENNYKKGSSVFNAEDVEKYSIVELENFRDNIKILDSLSPKDLNKLLNDIMIEYMEQVNRTIR